MTCLRVAELGATRLDLAAAEGDVGRILPRLLACPVGCIRNELRAEPGNATRCWTLEATNENGGVGVSVLGRPDGSLELPR